MKLLTESCNDVGQRGKQQVTIMGKIKDESRIDNMVTILIENWKDEWTDFRQIDELCDEYIVTFYVQASDLKEFKHDYKKAKKDTK
jgi:hypothetical protein